MADRRSIFITGAASGVGAATARRFAREGWLVGCFDVDDAGIRALSDELGDAVCGVLDVTDEAAFVSVVEMFGERSGGRMDVLHNNAGVIVSGPFEEMPWESIERIVRVNLLGAMIGVRAALPLLRATTNSLSFATCSASAIFGSAGLAAYSASKHGLRGFTEAISVELSPYGIRVGDVMPGFVETAMFPSERKNDVPADGMWRLMPPEAVADAVWDAYHATDEQLHRFVPPELFEYQQLAVAHPEAVRDEGRERLAAFLEALPV